MWRRRSVLAAGAALAATGLMAKPAPAAPAPAAPARPRIDYTMPTLAFDRPNNIAAAYESALTNVIGINTAHATPSTYDRAGLVTYPPGTFVRAGGGYPEPQRWTRDAAVNAWNATSLLSPLTGRNTLMTVVDEGLIVQQDDQWWDQIIWVPAAWHHYQVTGDARFLADAYQISTRTMAAHSVNATHGLFRGPSFMNDGISGYPAPPWRTGIRSSFVLDYPGADELMCLSTNCLYHGAHLALAGMAQALGKPAQPHRDDAARLRNAINRHLWLGDTYAYFLHGNGVRDTSQESAGLAFAVLLGVADADQTRRLLNNVHWEPRGITTSWPHFGVFDDQHPGRHNGSVWPVVHSMFGHAAAVGGRTDLLARAITDLTNLVADNGFAELYHPRTGAVDGGWQTDGSGEITHWVSQPDQAWSATGYLRMIYAGLFGLRFGTGLSLAPSLPDGWGPVSLHGLPYREATLDITLTGAGNRVVTCTVNGQPSSPALPASAAGHHTIVITLG